jgi:hypothetical protein
MKAAPDQPQSPSELAKSGSKTARPVTFVLIAETDLRLLFCTPAMLESRINRHVCVIDNAVTGPQEILVREGELVEDILHKRDKQWSGRSQLRLVSMNTIEQTPFVRSQSTESSQLLRHVIRPGDILILTVTD